MPRDRKNRPLPRAPVDVGTRDGLSYALFAPDGPPRGGIVILHGAGSAKESHFDYARAACDFGLAAVAFDQRGHGDSDGALDDRLAADVATIAELLEPGPVALRGSSLGGYVALAAAGRVEAAAVVAICPAGTEHLLRGLRSGTFAFAVDRPALEAHLEQHPLEPIVAGLTMPLLLLHAEGDDSIPAAHSAALHRAAGMAHKRLLVLPGGHHRSVQHDPELQGESLRFVVRAFAEAAPAGG